MGLLANDGDSADDKDWAARNKTNGDHSELDDSTGGKVKYFPFVHSFYAMIPPEKHFKEHPEYFSLIDGKRRVERGQLCLTNPDVLRLGIEAVERWIRERENRDENIEGQRKEILEDNPVISIVMAVYRTPIPLLRKAIQSVQTQTFPDWELVIANGSSYDSAIQYLLQEAADNDSRIKIITLEENLGIARNMNAALAAAAGDWVTFLDHDDMLAPFALYEVAETIRLRHKADFIYSDEDHMAADGKKRFEPHFKPSFSPETLLSYNYICHMIVIKKNLVAKIGNFRPEMEGSQDYDLILRAVEKASCVVRIPKILYHWRTSPTSVSDNPESKLHAYSAARAALTDCLKRRKLDGEVHDGQFLSSYQITYRIPENTKVSVIIPNKDHAGDLAEAALRGAGSDRTLIALRDELVHHFLHGYHDYADLLNKTQKISEGAGHADMIQDLSDLAVLGKANSEPLKKINIDLTLLDKAAALSEDMAGLLAKANGQKAA